MIRTLSLVVALSLANAAQASPADLASAKATIDRVNADWLPALKAKDGDRLAAAYAADGVFVLPNGQAVVGRAAVADLYRKGFAGGRQVLDATLHGDGLAEAAGGLIIEWGHGVSTSVDAGGKTTKSEGPYLTVWKRASDGRWEIVRNLAF